MLFLLALLTIAAAQAQEASVCGPLNNANDIIECVKTKAPSAQSITQNREASFDESKAARRWLNPIIQNQSLFGKSLGNEQTQFQFGVFQTVELWSRWSYKNKLSTSIETRANAEYQNELGKSLVDAGSDLIRLSQIKVEIASVEEAISAFNRLIGQFSNRPKLGPEQEVTVAVYKLSRGDFLVRQNTLIREREQIYARLRSTLSLSNDELVKASEVPKIYLPEVNINDFPESTSPELKLVDADLTSAQANLSLARADAFDSIQIGPMAQFDTDGPLRSQMIGFQVVIPFPLWNQNGYGIDAAAKRLKAADIRSAVKRKYVRESWIQLVKNYQRLKTLLNDIPTPDEIESRHKRVENQIYRGLVSSALVVESHRSLLDLQKSRHESELAALTTYWSILTIQGKALEIRL